jgi:hypothetical protein
MRITIENEKTIQATRATKEHKNTLSQVTNELSWFGGLERIWSLECVLECSLLLLQWMWSSEHLDAIEGGGWGVFIASNQFLVVGCFCCRWAHGTVRWCIGQVLFTVRCVPRQHARWGLERLTVGVLLSCSCNRQSGGTPDMSGEFWLCSLTSNFALHTFAVDRWHRLPLLRWLTGHVRCTPDSPVNYSGACPGKSREWPVRVVLGLGHRTLSGAPLAAHSQVVAPNFCWIPNLIYFLVYVEPYAPMIKDILAN